MSKLYVVYELYPRDTSGLHPGITIVGVYSDWMLANDAMPEYPDSRIYETELDKPFTERQIADKVWQDHYDDGYKSGKSYHLGGDSSAKASYHNESDAYQQGFDQAGQDS